MHSSQQVANLSEAAAASAAARTSERRKWPRREREYRLLASSGATQCRGYTRDISRGGAGVLLWDELPVGKTISLAFILPEAPTRVAAVVQYRIGFRYGLQFCLHDGAPELIDFLMTRTPDGWT